MVQLVARRAYVKVAVRLLWKCFFVDWPSINNTLGICLRPPPNSTLLNTICFCLVSLVALSICVRISGMLAMGLELANMVLNVYKLWNSA